MAGLAALIYGLVRISPVSPEPSFTPSASSVISPVPKGIDAGDAGPLATALAR